MGTAESKREYHLATQSKSGLSIREYCRREKLNHLTFYKWRSGSRGAASSSLPFISVTPAATEVSCVVRFPDGAELRVHDAGDGRSIAALVSALRAGAPSRC
jgi:hypothetical protein